MLKMHINVQNSHFHLKFSLSFSCLKFMADFMAQDVLFLHV